MSRRLHRRRSLGLLLAVFLAFAFPAFGFPTFGLAEPDQDGENGWHELLPAGRSQQPSRGERLLPPVLQAPLASSSGSGAPARTVPAATAPIRLLIHRFNE